MSGKKILVVDDNELIGWGLKKGLSSRGDSVSVMADMGRALDALATERHEIVFLDIHLPDGNGLDLLDRIRNESPETRVVVITANPTERDRDRALRSGAYRFLAKPFSISEIRGIVAEIEQP